MSSIDNRRGAALTAFFVTLLWSSSWVIMRVGMDDEELPPLTFAGMRYVAAAVVLGVVTAARPATRTEVRSLSAPALRQLALLGVLFYAINQGAVFVAVEAQPVATTSLVLHTSPLVTTTVSMSVGAILLLSTGFAVDGFVSLSMRAVVIIAWLAVVNTALAFTLWNLSLRHLNAGESAVINNTMMLQIAFLGWLFLDEAPTGVQWIGLVVVSAGIAIAQLRGHNGAAIRTLVEDGQLGRPLEPGDGFGDRTGAPSRRSR
jgi:drug/metabolite transporter (DMT)-like permease